MNQPFDLREVWQSNFNRTLQVEMKNGDVMRGKLIIVDGYTGHRGTFRRITDQREYLESNGMRGMQEMTLLSIDIKSFRPLD